MEATILNSRFEKVAIIDRFKSFIWTDRYQENGDFELYLTLDMDGVFPYLVNDYYLQNDDSVHMMIIQGMLLETNTTEGPTIKVIGYSLESLLKRRIIWDNTTLGGNFQDGIEKLINDAIIAPSKSERKIPNFVFKKSTDSRITALTIDAKYEQHENLYEAINSLCIEKQIGFKVTLNENKQFEFELYKGIDRSYAQQLTPYVVFSPSFENLNNTSYLDSKEDYANVALTVGEDGDTQTLSGNPLKITKEVTRDGETQEQLSGMHRCEIYVDAGSITSEDEDHKMSDAERLKVVAQKGKEALAEKPYTISMDGDVDPHTMFVYGRDFKMGDVVQIENDYGIKGTSTVSEFIMSQDSSGETSYPTFTDFVSADDNRIPVGS